MVPSHDVKHSPSMNRVGSSRYVLTSTFAMDGQRFMAFVSAAFLFRLLKALEASTNRTVSVCSSWKMSFMACRAASHPHF